MIDPQDARLAAYRWHLDKGYVARSVRSGHTVRKVYLHREVLGLAPGDGVQGDHRNLNKLDCRRSNLRVATNALNAQNQTSYAGSSSTYRGVSLHRQTGKWRAEGKRDGKNHYLGLFAREEDAAAAARAWRLAHLPFTNEDALHT